MTDVIDFTARLKTSLENRFWQSLNDAVRPALWEQAVTLSKLSFDPRFTEIAEEEPSLALTWTEGDAELSIAFVMDQKTGVVHVESAIFKDGAGGYDVSRIGTLAEPRHDREALKKDVMVHIDRAKALLTIKAYRAQVFGPS